MDFHFLLDPAGFSLSEGWLSVGLKSPYWAVLLAGVLNTLKVALPALLLATVLGSLVGLGRLARQPVIRVLADAYVGLFRNVPLLILLLAVYFLIIQGLPVASQAWSFGGLFYLSKSGFAVPNLFSGQLPRLGYFSVEGGWVLSPEYCAVLLALVLYTAAFIAEVVRAGVQSVPSGLVQAGFALGLNRIQLNRLVVLPVALRVIVPALGNQYLNLLKNASLGVAVGYPELVSVSNTAMNQSGKVVQCVLLILAVYALISVLATFLIGRWNASVNRGGA